MALQIAAGLAVATMTTLVTFSSAVGSSAAVPAKSMLVISHNMYSTVTVHTGEKFLVKNADHYDHTVKIMGSRTDSLIHGGAYLILTAPSKAGSYKLCCDLNHKMLGVLRVVH